MIDLTGSMDFFNQAAETVDYLFMNKNEVVATFSLELGIEPEVCNVEAIRLPDWIKDFPRFITHRSAPRGREHIQELLELSGCNTIQGFLDITHGLSLTDTFWVKKKDSSLTWEKVSLFRNPFNEVIARTAFDGGLYGDNLSTPSPEYSTNGTYAKCWIREDNKIKMLKQGSSGARNAGLEPYSELYASQVARAFRCDHVEYEIRCVNGRVCSVCECFTNEQYGYVPFNSISDAYTLKGISKIFAQYGLIERFADMQILDALVFNEDRHKGNFGFIFDTTTYELVGMAPLFDHNVSLLCYAEEKDFNEVYLKSRYPRIGMSFVDNAKIFLYSNAERRLINMKGFRFDRGKIALPEWRLKKLEDLINHQIELILKS